MPCHLNSDVHEWSNEIVAVPKRKPLKILAWRKCQGCLTGSEDLVDLYYNLLL